MNIKEIATAYKADLNNTVCVCTDARKDLLQHIEDIKGYFSENFGDCPRTIPTSTPDTYANLNELMTDIDNGAFSVYANDLYHPLLSQDENYAFRYVHDLCHYICEKDTGKCGFGVEEFNVWKMHCKIVDLSPRIQNKQPLKFYLFSEIMGQASYFLTFGQFPDQSIRIDGELFKLYREKYEI